MTIFKWLGAVALLLCGAAVGLLVRAHIRRRCQQAEAYLTLLRHIRRQIDLFCAPQARIFAECDAALLVACGASGERPQSFSDLLSRAPLSLPENIKSLLSSLSGELGRGYREEQLRVLDECISRLSFLARELREELPRLEKLAPVLPFALSAALVLLFI